MEEYEINSSTMAIIPIDDNTSKVYEEDTEYIINESSNSIIRNNCRFFGSSYEGRCIGTKSMTGIKTKYPIIIEESRNIIFFPTTSSRTQQSAWLALNKIKFYMRAKNNIDSEILFINNKTIPLKISIYSLENQICRASILKIKLIEIKEAEKLNNS